MSGEPTTLESLFAYFYGPVIGRSIATLGAVRADEHVVFVGLEQRSPAGPPVGESSDTVQPDDLGVADPLPTIDIVQWRDEDGAHPSLPSGWDVLVGLPPHGGPRRDDQLAAFLQIASQSARPGARAVLILAAGSLSSGSPMTRQALLDVGSVSSLLFPAGRLPPASGVAGSLRVALVVWTPGEAPAPSTRVIAVSADGEIEGEFAARLSDEQRWSYASLDPARAAKLQSWAERTDARPLKELASFPRGREESEDDLVVLNPRQITAAGLDLAVETREYEPKRDGPLVRLRSGDIIGRTIGEPNWVLVDDVEDDSLGVGRQVMVIRPERIDPSFLLAFLRSDAATLQFEAAGETSTIPRISPSALRGLLVPAGLADAGSVRSDTPIREFRSASQALADELDARYKAAFDRASVDGVRAALTDATGEAVMALDLLRRASDPLHRARQFLPHPLARTIRLYQDDLRGGTPQDVFGDLLRFGETAITLLGIVGLSYAAHIGRSASDVDLWRRSLDRGVPLGNWLSAANAGARVAREAGESLGGLASALSSNSPLNRALDTFLERRNDQAHGAGPRSSFEYEQSVVELQEKLTIAVDELAPLARSDWFVVSSLRWSRGSGTFSIIGRSLAGDHPDFVRWEAERSTPLESGVVFARFGSLDLPLTGFCQMRSCATCLNEELYYPDRLRGSMVRLRSLDRGHQTDVTLSDLGLASVVEDGDR